MREKIISVILTTEKTPILKFYKYAKLYKNYFSEIFILTDNEKLKEKFKDLKLKNVIFFTETEKEIETIASIVKNINFDEVMFFRNDGFFIGKKKMKKLIDVIGKNKNEYVFTAITLIKEEKDLYNQEIVKTVVDKNNYVLYFSRSLIPYPKIYFMEKNLTKNKEVFFYKLAGISIFRKNFLLKFSSLPFSNLENIEKIEYLRIIENGYKIKVVKI